MKEGSISSRIYQSIKKSSNQEPLLHRTNKILNPEARYKQLGLYGLENGESVTTIHDMDGNRTVASQAVNTLTSTLTDNRKLQWVNKKRSDSDPFNINQFPNERLQDEEVRKTTTFKRKHQLFRNDKVLTHEHDGIKNIDFLRFIVQTASNLAKADKLKTLTYDTVLQHFASVVALAQIHFVKDIKKIIDFSPLVTNAYIQTIHIDEKHKGKKHKDKKIDKLNEPRDKKFIETNIRTQILTYAIGVFSLYGFQDVMQLLMKEKAKLI